MVKLPSYMCAYDLDFATATDASPTSALRNVLSDGAAGAFRYAGVGPKYARSVSAPPTPRKWSRTTEPAPSSKLKWCVGRGMYR
jgi:hypothetical protein